MKNKTSQSGFTLIELIAVMVILGILAAVIIPRISTITSGAYESNVRNMYGLIKNEVNAQAIKAAMSGDFLEKYPNINETAAANVHVVASSETDGTILDLWVDDYDPDAWSQFHVGPAVAAQYGDNQSYDVGGNLESVNTIVFMYHPHGEPANGAVTVQSHDCVTGGTSTSIEDIYWIMYYPRTSSAGSALGRDIDGYVMAAWKDDGDLKLEGTISAAGVVASAGGDIKIEDLDYCLCPGG